MKKYFYLAAVSAMMLTACSSDKDVLEPKTGPAVQEITQQAVGFDVYVPAATAGTRAGLEGTMTTSHMQLSEAQGGGFGVYAIQIQDQVAGAGYGANATAYGGRTTAVAPNFMANEKLLWNENNQGWYYSPLKYWPNETDNDSQNTNATMLGDGTNNHIDRLTFFAYAPYVEQGNTANPGITHITNNAGILTSGKVSEAGINTTVVEPSIGYKASIDDPNKAVDLLWGVAPAGGINYTAVNGKTVTVKEGEPLIDMTKPDVNTSMKFLFQHALARIGVTAVAAVDQIGAGGKLDPNTKITIEKITLKGYFGESGILNLDNPIANVANWYEINGKALSAAASATTVDATTLPQRTITLVADHTAGGDPTNHQLGSIARHLQFVGTPAANQSDPSNAPVAQVDRVGVTTVRQNVIMPSKATGNTAVWTTKKTYAANELAYSETTPYYTDAACGTQATVTLPESWSISSTGVITTKAADASFAYPKTVDTYAKGTWYQVTAADVTAKTYDSYQAYSDATGVKSLKSGKPAEGDYVVKDGFLFEAIVAGNADSFAGQQSYTEATGTYTPTAVGTAPAVGTYVICGTMQKPVVYYAAGDYYKRDANYFMVVPINNVPNICTSLTDKKELEKLRTVTVQIEYYITTEDSKLAGGLAQTKNVITKDVVFPSIANGKSYNLNLVLGLTSVKMDAEVDEWRVINVNGDLPQNTAD